MAVETRALLRQAADLADLTLRPPDAADDDRLTAFIDSYRAWIIVARDMADSPARWTDQNKLLLHSMLGAGTLEEALEILERFSPTLWGDHLRIGLRNEGAMSALTVNEPVRHGMAGLLCEIWPLTIILAQLEFLAGGRVPGATGEVRNAPVIAARTVGVFFGRPLRYATARTALLLPTEQLARPVVARAAAVPRLFDGFIGATLGLCRAPAPMRAAVYDLIRNDRLHDRGVIAGLPDVARQMGLSPATIRRRLAAEGTGYRRIRDDALDALARHLLGGTGDPIEHIAARLGYSDGYAFRRAFRRRNAISPQMFRRNPVDAGSAG